jgi:hypothetical protein
MRPKPSLHDWITLTTLGAALGALLLGIGGRMAMSVIALSTGQPPAWTLGGTLAVIALGAASGVAGAVIRLATAWVVPSPRWVESVLFGLAVAWLTARGLRPVQLLPLALFGPLVAAYAVTLETLWRRRANAEPRPQVA